VTRKARRAPSAVDKTILRLRADSQKKGEGALIGSEEELLARYGVSRPTLRQAAAIVAREQLLKVRRGMSGGYFATRPAATAVSHVAAIYLSSHGTSVEQILHAVELIRTDVVRLAAEMPDSPLKAELRDFLEEDEAARGLPYSQRRFARSEREFYGLVGALCGNNALHLFLEILLDLVGILFPVDNMAQWTADRIDTAVRRRSRAIRAILDGDAAAAMLESEDAVRQTRTWIAEGR
jgi:GntR family transcriptional repressor for pyruvate dehydrogenase complex